MLSLYLHIPFCHKKCGYCSFPVIPTENLQEPLGMAEQYKTAIFRDIQYWAEKISSMDSGSSPEGQTSQEGQYDKSGGQELPTLKTIYIGGGTPLLLGSQYLIDILAEVEKKFDCSNLQELTIECNPYPYDETLQALKDIMQRYTHISRLRFSFGIQSLDDEILQKSDRECSFEGIQQFTKDILEIKQPNILYNYDFIAFGEMDSGSSSEGQATIQGKRKQRLQELIQSKQIDSFSLYTLELFPGSKWYHETKDPLIAYQAPWDHDMPFATSEDTIFNSFDELKKLFLAGGYSRYEISNYALSGKESIHNQVYWTMGSYLGIGLGAHGFLQGKNPYRTETTGGWKNYILGPTKNTYKQKECSKKDIMIESFFLGLRKQSGIVDLSHYTDILQDNRQQCVHKLVENKLCLYENNTLQLTDLGMNIHHQVCTYLMKEI